MLSVATTGSGIADESTAGTIVVVGSDEWVGCDPWVPTQQRMRDLTDTGKRIADEHVDDPGATECREQYDDAWRF